MNATYHFYILMAGLFLCGTVMAAEYPVKVSDTNPRNMVDRNNVPFMMVGDSPHSLLANLSVADTASYLADREANGFNSLWVELLNEPYTGGRPDSSLLDGTLPFTQTIPGTTNYDLTTPNEAYFAYVDQVIRMAATNGIEVLLDPIDTAGMLQTARDNGVSRCRAYGQYLGNRYKDFPNLIWMNGNDFQTWTNAGDDAVFTAVALGIKDEDTNHLQTVELEYFASSSLDDSNWAPIVGLNLAYTYYPTYAEVLHAYNQSTNMPVFMGEAYYDLEVNDAGPGEQGTPGVLRRQEYWTMLSGASGQMYGNDYIWQFKPGWQTHLDTTGVTQLQYMAGFFSSRAWYNLVPDSNHTVVTSGYGTFEDNTGTIGADTYLTAASTPDGTLGIAYMPTVRTIKVNLATFSGTVTARWFDPGNGTYSAIAGSPLANTGTHSFTPPGNNSAGDTDWVLVLETAPPLTPVQPTFIQQNYATPQTPQNVVSVQFPSAQNQGDANILAVGWTDTNASISTVSDSAGNPYQVAVPTYRSNGMSQAIYYAPNITAGANTVTVTFDQPANYVDLRAVEYAGLAQSNCFDAGNSASGFETGADSGSVTIGSTNELVFGAGITWDEFTEAGAGFATIIITAPNYDIAESKIATLSGTYDATATVNSSAGWLMQIAAFKPQVVPPAVLVQTTIVLTSDSNPSTYGNPVTFTATVQTNGVAAGGIYGETVTFYVGATQLGVGMLNGSGQASYTTTATQLAAGGFSITAAYAGDAVFSASSNSPALSQAVSEATVTPALTGSVSKNYDGTLAATLALGNYSLNGVFTGDNVTLNNPTSGTYDTKDHGTGKTVTVTNLAISGASANNYTLSSTSASGMVGVINKTNITVTAAANTKTYDGNTSAAAVPTVTSGSVQSGDNANFTESYDTNNVGTGKTLTPSGLVNDGNGGNNYSVTFAATADGTITANTLTYLANTASMIYGSAVPGLSGMVNGFVGSDNQGNATSGTLNFTTSATSSSNVGDYSIIGSGLSAINNNYTFVQAAGNSTALAIEALSVNLSGTRPYDRTTAVPADILSVANKISGDNVTVVSGSGTLADANVGLEPITSFGNLSLGGTAGLNYTLIGASGSVNITTAGATTTNLSVLNKVYDGTTNANLDATNAELVGVLNGDTVTLAASNAVVYFKNKNVGTNKPVTVTGLALRGAAATNYSLTDPTNETANIASAGLTVNGVTAVSKVYDGTTNAQLTGSATLNGVVSGDDVSLVASNATAKFADPNVGTNKTVTVNGYAIIGADAGNYTLAEPAGLTADIIPLVTPVFSIPAILDGAEGRQLNFSGQAGQTYKVLVADDLQLPLYQWIVLTNGTFGAGNVTVTDASTNMPRRFYQIVSP